MIFTWVLFYLRHMTRSYIYRFVSISNEGLKIIKSKHKDAETKLAINTVLIARLNIWYIYTPAVK